MKSKVVCITLLLIVAATASGGGHQDVYLGALVDFQSTPLLRAAFRASSDGWSSLCQKRRPDCARLPQSMSRFWPITSSIGEASITVKGSHESRYVSGMSLYELLEVPPNKLAATGQRVSGWNGWNQIVLLSTKRSQTKSLPQAEASLSQHERRDLVAAFLGAQSTSSWCNHGKAKCGPEQVEIAEVLAYEPQFRLVSVRFQQKYHGCNEGAYDHCSSLWYAVRSDGSIRPLDVSDHMSGGWAADLIPLAAGDFDGDSQNEYVFWLNAYNENGFVLFSRGFSQRAVFSYGYH